MKSKPSHKEGVNAKSSGAIASNAKRHALAKAKKVTTHHHKKGK